MTDDLKTKIAEAINALPFADGMISYNVVQAALQAIHDAGYDLTPRAESAPWGKVTARAARLAQAQAEVNREGEFLVERIDDLDWSEFEGLTREWIGHVEPSLSRFRIALQTAQPNTEEKT